MIPHYSESGTHLEPVGWTVDRCPACDEIQALACSKVVFESGSLGILGARFKRTVQEFALECWFCRSIVAVPASSQLPLDPSWRIEHGLQALVDSTRPDLGVLEQRRVGERAISVLLRSFESQYSDIWRVLNQNSTEALLIGALAGGAAFAFLGNLLVAFGPHSQQAWSVGVCLMIAPPGFLLGAVVGGLRSGWTSSRAQLGADLRAAIRRFGLDPRRLREIASADAASFKNVSRVLETIDAAQDLPDDRLEDPRRGTLVGDRPSAVDKKRLALAMTLVPFIVVGAIVGAPLLLEYAGMVWKAGVFSSPLPSRGALNIGNVALGFGAWNAMVIAAIKCLISGLKGSGSNPRA